MHRLLFLIAFIQLSVAPALAQTPTANEAFRKQWHLCQSGDIDWCNRLLKLPLDAETRSLIEVDRDQAHERIIVQVRALMLLCTRRGYVSACDRALRFSLTQAERGDILELRKAVVIRASRSAR